MATRPQPRAPLTTQEELGAVLPEILPEQGMWTDEQYLWLTDGSNRLVEFTDGYVRRFCFTSTSSSCRSCGRAEGRCW